jgi:tRNA(Ile)-lysidine synthase
MLNLPKGVVAIKEYDKIVFYKQERAKNTQIPFSFGEFDFSSKTISIEKLTSFPKNLKDGLYFDADKIPKTAVIRARLDGDCFTKFSGGSKSLNDYFTDKKIPLRERDFIPLIANGGEILAIFGVAISDKIKIDDGTKQVAKLYLED